MDDKGQVPTIAARALKKTDEVSSRIKWRPSRRCSVLLMIIGVLLIALGVSSQLSQFVYDDPKGLPLPEQLSSIPLTKETSGAEAVLEFYSIHGQNFGFIAAAVGHYEGDVRATVYVGETILPVFASWAIFRMARVLDNLHSPFLEIDNLTMGGRWIKYMEGLGQRHYYFQSGRYVIWLAADRAVSEEALRQVVDFYQ